ncbi:MAG: protein-L-isoaspartate O-methyltransferase, partial [Eudoraea sp.]|nr:protein-L-isoaspartate O-methyltransferase [Eudoraea sp.]
DDQIMTRIIRNSEKEFERQEFGSFRFVPLLEDKN